MKSSFILRTVLLVLCVFGILSGAEIVRTEWRFYEQNLGLIASFPVKFEAQGGSFALTYKGFGLGTTVFDLHAWDLFKNFDSTHKFIAVIAPATIYYIPWASHRRSKEITPVVFNFHATACFWGLKNTKLLDFGFGFQYYLFQFGAGYKSIRSESRNFFVPESETGFHDYPVRNNTFYISLNITPGLWEALGSKIIKPPEPKPAPDSL
jgi:hypothetical protein